MWTIVWALAKQKHFWANLVHQCRCYSKSPSQVIYMKGTWSVTSHHWNDNGSSRYEVNDLCRKRPELICVAQVGSCNEWSATNNRELLTSISGLMWEINRHFRIRMMNPAYKGDWVNDVKCAVWWNNCKTWGPYWSEIILQAAAAAAKKKKTNRARVLLSAPDLPFLSFVDVPFVKNGVFHPIQPLPRRKRPADSFLLSLEVSNFRDRRLWMTSSVRLITKPSKWCFVCQVTLTCMVCPVPHF